MNISRYNVLAVKNFLRWRTTVSDAAPQTIFEVTLPTPELSKGEREYRAFQRLLPELLLTHKGKYVGIHEGKLVDADDDDIVLVHRMHDRVGYVPIYVGLVTDQPVAARVGYLREYKREKEA
jgi:hypothetical protein